MTRARARTRSNIFSADYLPSIFPNATRPHAARNGGAIVHFFLLLLLPLLFIRTGALATHLRGEKRVARPPGISSDILFMRHLIHTDA